MQRNLILLMALAWLAGNSTRAQEPVLHWSFDQEGGVAVDSGGGEPANGVFQATAGLTSDTPGSASPFALDLTEPGLDSWVMGPDAEKVDILESFTMTTWVKLLGWNDGGSSNQRLLAKQAAGNFPGFSWNANAPDPVDGDPGPGNFRMGMFIGGQGFDDVFSFGFAFSEPIGAEEWTFLAVTYDGENEDAFENLNFYLGDEMVSVSQVGDPFDLLAGPVATTAGEATINVGYTDAAPGNDFSVNGYMDDVRIYAEVLTLEQLEQVRLANLMTSVTGDYDGDGLLGPGDLDVLAQYMKDNNLAGDLDGNGATDAADRELWIRTLQNSWVGDSNFDGEFNSTDFVAVFTVGKYETGEMAGYAEGDWNGDMVFDSSDFVAAFSDGGFEQGPRGATAAVPEPGAVTLMLIGLCFLRRRRR